MWEIKHRTLTACLNGETTQLSECSSFYRFHCVVNIFVFSDLLFPSDVGVFESEHPLVTEPTVHSVWG